MILWRWAWCSPQSYRELKKFADAQEVFLLLLQIEGLPNTQILNMKHSLAEMYLKDSKLDAALLIALESFEGWHQLHVTNTDSFYDACCLVVDVYTSQGDEAEAEVYLDFIPNDYRPDSMA